MKKILLSLFLVLCLFSTARADYLMGGGGGGSISTYADVVAVFGSGACSGYLKSDGTCDTPAAAFDPTNPGPIGGTTPAAGNFTGLSVTSAASTGSAISVVADSLTSGVGIKVTSSSANGGDFISAEATGAFQGDLFAIAGGTTSVGRGVFVTGGTGSNPQMRVEGGTRTGTVLEVTQPVTGASAITSLGNLLITNSGDLGLTGSRVHKGWFTDLEITNLPTVNGGTLKSAAGYYTSGDSPTFAAVTISKTPSTPGTSLLWDDYSTELYGDGWKGSHQTGVLGANRYYQFPTAAPSGGQVMVFPTPTGDTSTATWATAPSGTIVGTTDTQTLTNKNISLVPVACSANCSPTAVALSNGIINNYGQTSSNSVITGPTPVAGMNFTMIHGSAPTGSAVFEYSSTAANIYLDNSSTAVTNVIFTIQPMGSGMACVSFQTGASAYSLKCTTLAGTATTS